MGMLRVESETVIERPVNQVFQFAANVSNHPLWVPAVAEVRRSSAEEPVGPQETFVQAVQFLGRRFEATFRVIEVEADRRIVFESISGPVEMKVSETYEAIGEQTRVNQVLQGEPRGFFNVASPLLVKLTKRQLDNAVANLKDILESGDA